MSDRSPDLDPWAVLDDFHAGYLSGYLAGLDAGREQADREAARLHQQAWRIVQAAARIETYEELQRRRRDYPSPSPVRDALAAARPTREGEAA